MHAVIVTLIILAGIFSLPLLFQPKKITLFNDNQLRENALTHGLKSVPKDYSALLKIVNTPFIFF